jgi:hypothetical protein
VTHAIDESFVAGFRVTMLLAAGMAIASAIAAFVLVEGKAIALPDDTA